MRDNEKQSWAVSPSNVAYHFGTSGLSVAVATGITHPLGKILNRKRNKNLWMIFFFQGYKTCWVILLLSLFLENTALFITICGVDYANELVSDIDNVTDDSITFRFVC